MLGAEHFFFGKASKFPAKTSEACFKTQSSTNQTSTANQRSDESRGMGK
jgi:hypothetical protein